MDTKNKKPFIPKDKPKSWVIGILSGLIGLLVAGPIMFMGVYFGYDFVKGFGVVIFVACWVIGFLSWFVFIIGMLRGKYKNIQECDWNKQLW